MKKQEKKFVLAGLALLAITGLLALAGCKNDTVPEPTRYTVKFDKNAEDASGEMQSQIFTEGVEQELSVNQFKRATYTFSGWSEDKAATAPTYKDKAKFKATKDTTLYAVWTDNGTVSPVTFSLPDGTKFYFGESIEVSLETTTEGATIHYQLGEGEWKIYEKPFTVFSETVVTAYATKDGLKDSEKTKSNYLRQLISISVTPPTRTVYSVGESFDDSGMVVTATYNDGESKDVTSLVTTDFDFSSAGVKTVIVSYSEGGSPVTKDFRVDVVNVEEPTKLTTYTSPNNTGSEWTYVAFGEWPQTIKAEGVDVDETKSKTMGMFTCYLGSDGNYYVEQKENAYGSGTEYQYSNGKQAGQGGTSTKWFKVEPIVWRVLNKDYASTNKALLLAESILTGGIKWANSRNNYMQSYIRQWLNGNSGTEETSDYNGDAGFLQTAFTEFAQKLIADTTVDNSAASTTDAGNNLPQADGCSDTTDKVFLLSETEATTGAYLKEKGITDEDYGFAIYSDSGKGNTRIRVTTDYAKATGAYQSEGYGGWWWLRSPYSFREDVALVINTNGIANGNRFIDRTDAGVVPALSISLKGNLSLGGKIFLTEN